MKSLIEIINKLIHLFYALDYFYSETSFRESVGEKHRDNIIFEVKEIQNKVDKLINFEPIKDPKLDEFKKIMEEHDKQIIKAVIGSV